MIPFWKEKRMSALLWPLSLVYQWVVRIRNRNYDGKMKKISRLNCKVISVGNITVGGTGKTPLVMTVAEWLRAEGRRVAILSRGHGRNGRTPFVVSDGKEIQSNVSRTGDEPLMMARRLPDVPVIVGVDRSRAGRMATELFHPDILILDDGFQHRRVARDLDVVVLDATCPFGNGWLIPAGPLREPLSALKRADLVVLSRSDQVKDAERSLQAIRKWTDAPILMARHKPLDWFRLDTEEIMPLDHLRDQFCLAFSGIGNPDSFERTIRSIGIQRMKALRFGDHHRYSKWDFIKIDQAAEKFGAMALITTEKDGVRLGRERHTQLPVYTLRVAFEIDRGKEHLMSMLSQ
jgi:tetraacyldisaccharide 4'-kinase